MSEDDAKNDIRHRIDQTIAQEELDDKFPTDKANFDRIAKSLDEEGYSPEHITEGIESFKARENLHGPGIAPDRKRLRVYLPSLPRLKWAAYRFVPAVAALTFVSVVGLYVERVWNSTDYAMETLSKYDKHIKITDPEEEKKIISAIDDLLEEFAIDEKSDHNAIAFYHDLDRRGHSLAEFASRFYVVGKLNDEVFIGSVLQIKPSALGNATFDLMDAMRDSGMSAADLDHYLKIAKPKFRDVRSVLQDAVGMYQRDNNIKHKCFPSTSQSR